MIVAVKSQKEIQKNLRKSERSEKNRDIRFKNDFRFNRDIYQLPRRFGGHIMEKSDLSFFSIIFIDIYKHLMYVCLSKMHSHCYISKCTKVTCLFLIVICSSICSDCLQNFQKHPRDCQFINLLRYFTYPIQFQKMQPLKKHYNSVDEMSSFLYIVTSYKSVFMIFVRIDMYF